MSCASTLLQVAVATPLVAALALAFSKWLPCGAKKAIAGIGFVVPVLIAVTLLCAFPCAEKISGYAFYSSCEMLGVPSLGIWLQFPRN